MDRNPPKLLTISVLIVALRKESVDRNNRGRGEGVNTGEGRSPQGERG